MLTHFLVRGLDARSGEDQRHDPHVRARGAQRASTGHSPSQSLKKRRCLKGLTLWRDAHMSDECSFGSQAERRAEAQQVAEPRRAHTLAGRPFPGACGIR